MEPFKDWWSRTVGEVPPLGWLLRDLLHERWLRIHTLPDAKRYAETEPEHDEVLRRQNSVAGEILGNQEPCWLVVPTYQAELNQVLRLDELPGLDLLQVDVQLVDEVVCTFWAARVTWKSEVFGVALRAIADDRLRALWASKDGEVFAPYDGGVDIIAKSNLRRAELTIKFASWLSRHPSGL